MTSHLLPHMPACALLLPSGLADTGSPAAGRQRQSMQQSYFKDPELLPFELNMLEVALGEVRAGVVGCRRRRRFGRVLAVRFAASCSAHGLPGEHSRNVMCGGSV